MYLIAANFLIAAISLVAAIFFGRLLIFFKINFLGKFFQKYHQNVSSLDPNQAQTECQGCQHTALVDKDMPVDKRICLSQELFHFDNLYRVSQMKCRHLIQYVVKVFVLCMFSCYEIYNVNVSFCLAFLHCLICNAENILFKTSFASVYINMYVFFSLVETTELINI